MAGRDNRLKRNENEFDSGANWDILPVT